MAINVEGKWKLRKYIQEKKLKSSSPSALPPTTWHTSTECGVQQRGEDTFANAYYNDVFHSHCYVYIILCHSVVIPWIAEGLVRGRGRCDKGTEIKWKQYLTKMSIFATLIPIFVRTMNSSTRNTIIKYNKQIFNHSFSHSFACPPPACDPFNRPVDVSLPPPRHWHPSHQWV